MRTADLDFPLPERLIATHPAAERTGSRLLAVDCARGLRQHLGFAELPGLLRAGDLLVCNDTRVLPARLCARKATGGAVEGLWLESRGDLLAVCMLSGSRLRPGLQLLLGERADAAVRLERKLAPGRWLVADESGMGWPRLLGALGGVPLPPYIRSRRAAKGEPGEAEDDAERYQTVWAERAGAVAAPTASLHFDDGLRQRLQEQGIAFASLTLHVGPGTFVPVNAENLEDHGMHAEEYAVPAATVAALHAARGRAGRIVAVGTTVCRVLEHLGATGCGPADPAPAQDLDGATELFLRPGSTFRWTDALLTNFHTPRSTLLALVAAFAGHAGARDGLACVKEVYAEAVAREYRFFSYGDATFWS